MAGIVWNYLAVNANFNILAAELLFRYEITYYSQRKRAGDA